MIFGFRAESDIFLPASSLLQKVNHETLPSLKLAATCLQYTQLGLYRRKYSIHHRCCTSVTEKSNCEKNMIVSVTKWGKCLTSFPIVKTADSDVQLLKLQLFSGNTLLNNVDRKFTTKCKPFDFQAVKIIFRWNLDCFCLFMFRKR